jgi:hypothetical protein
MYHDKQVSEPVNKSTKIWALIKDELDKSERRCESITVNNNAHVILK